MKSCWPVTFWILMSFSMQTYGQSDLSRDKVAFEQIIENLLPVQEEDENYDALYDRLFSIYLQPLDLNHATYSQLQSLYLLSNAQIWNFLNYRKKYGQIYSVYELAAVDGFDPETISKIAPFVSIQSGRGLRMPFSKSLRYSKINQLILGFNQGLEQKKGYLIPVGGNTAKYGGGPARYQLRYNYSRSGYYSFGLVMEKDPGEPVAWDPAKHQFGLDYYAFHAMIENRGVIKRIIIGDYSLDFGQGLIFGSGFGIGKGTESINTVRRAGLGLRPYRSIYEYKDFHGLAITLGKKEFTFTGFYSQQRRDATLQVENESTFASALKSTGLHRTATEIASKSSDGEQSFGMNMDFSSNTRQLNIGLNTIYTHFQWPIIPKENNYNKYYFSGADNLAGSLYESWVLSNINVFGEAGISKGGGRGAVVGAVMSLTSSVQAAILWRNYSRDFHALHGLAFGENSSESNENGLYWGLKIQPVTALQFNFFIDNFRFPWLKYRVDAPSKGHEIMAASDYRVSQSLVLRIQFRQKEKSINFNDGKHPLNLLSPGTKQYFKLQVAYNPEGLLSLNTRVQYSNYHLVDKPTSGFLVAQDLSIHNHRWNITGRFALFDTDDYDNRQYVYENDVLYAYSVPFFQGKGSRAYILGKCSLNEHISIWAKYGKTIYENVGVVGSGLEEIAGNEKSSVSVLLRYKI